MKTKNSEEIKNILIQWHNKLIGNSENLRTIRKCTSPREVLNLNSNDVILENLNELGLNATISAALIGLAAQVDTNDENIEFICALGRARNKNQRPAYCEIHFEKLCKTQSLEIFFKRLKRAVIILQRRFRH